MAMNRSIKTHSLRSPRSGEDNEATTHCGRTGVQEKTGAEFLTEGGAYFRISGGEPSCALCRHALRLDKVSFTGKLRLSPAGGLAHG